MLIDPGPAVLGGHADRGARRRGPARDRAHAHPPRPRRRHGLARAPLARHAGLRARARRAAPDRPVEAVGERGPAVAGRHGRALGRGRPGPGGEHHLVGEGDEVFGMRVAYTPGHASHHVSYFHEDSGWAFVGDVAGVRVPPVNHTLMPTPPPDIDVEAWLESLALVESWSPQTIAVTHFGAHEDVGPRSTRPARSCAAGPRSPATPTRRSSAALPRGPRGADRRRGRARRDHPGERPAARVRRPRALLAQARRRAPPALSGL